VLNSRIFLCALASAALGACGDPIITWGEPATLERAIGSGDRLALSGDGVARLVPDSSPAAPAAAGQCRASVRMARDTTGEWYAVWWSALPDSTAEIVVARSADGATWEPAVRVDTVDAGRSGCRRPAPAIDAWGGHVHVVYAMAAREGPGIFASHSMDRGVLFHSPVAIVYGERIGAADIAARGNIVAIAFEDPNSAQDQIGLAYSNTMAHMFQHRQTVSLSGGGARSPRVALGEGRIAVAWMRAAGGADPVGLARVGTLRD